MADSLEIPSPLKAWPGKVELPHPDAFNGVHWQTWKESVNRPKRKGYALTHLYCYAGLELIKAVGEFEFDVTLTETQAWEDSPEDERMRLVSWIGRTIMTYMDDIMDPKE